MSTVFALYTSNPDLVRCELQRLLPALRLDAERSNAMGVGFISHGQVLLHRYGAVSPGVLPPEVPDAEMVMVHASLIPLGWSLEANVQPYRSRSWLFAHVGKLGVQVRARVLEQLPEHLRRQMEGDAEGELALGLFLKRLKEMSPADDAVMEAGLAAQALGDAARTLERLGVEGGATQRPELNLVASDGSLLVAAHLGDRPLYYALSEESDHCQRCGVDPSTPDNRPLAMQHRKMRTVAIASAVSRPATWLQLESGTALAVDRDLSIRTFAI